MARRAPAKRRVKILRPVEAFLSSKASKSDSEDSKQGAGADAQGGGKGEGKDAAAEAKKDESAEAKGAKDVKEPKKDQAQTDQDPKDQVPQDDGARAKKDDSKGEEEPSIYAELLPPRALGDKNPGDAAPAPGLAPRGDSRSFRRSTEDGEEFCLLYRLHRSLITRRGKVGKWGDVDVREYPSERAAATAYAHACSDLTGEGFYDLRE